MKCHSTLEICTSGSLKVKQYTTVITKQLNEGCLKDLEESSANTSSIVDELKKLNLDTNENPVSIYVSMLLIHSKEKNYFELLLEYKDVFAWTYKEMSSLDLKIAVHQLMVKYDV
ncbi:hypothetical protein AAG906_013640 [Vitis piasezkii]